MNLCRILVIRSQAPLPSRLAIRVSRQGKIIKLTYDEGDVGRIARSEVDHNFSGLSCLVDYNVHDKLTSSVNELEGEVLHVDLYLPRPEEKWGWGGEVGTCTQLER